MPMTVAVVILNWNGRALLETYLPSVVAFSSEANIYLADNASTDDSVEYVRAAFPMVKIIQNTTNGGYAKGYNDALKELNEDIFVLLNSDVEVTEHWLEPVIHEFRQNNQLVAAQPKILDASNRELFEYAGAAGGYLDRFGYPYCRGRLFNTLEKDEGQYNDNRKIFWASGACFFVKRTAFWKAGGFDEDFFAHQEEIDLCWRLQSIGGEVRYIANSTVYHLGGGTLDSANPRKTYYNFRNTLLSMLKNVKGPRVYFLIFIRLLLDGVAGMRFLMRGEFVHILAIIRAHFGFYRKFGKFMGKRRKHASNLQYFEINSLVWKYFVAKKRTFNNL